MGVKSHIVTFFNFLLASPWHLHYISMMISSILYIRTGLGLVRTKTMAKVKAGTVYRLRLGKRVTQCNLTMLYPLGKIICEILFMSS